MEYRCVTPEERLTLMDMQARLFYFTYDRKKYEQEAESGELWRHGRGAFDASGKLVAGLDLLPFDAWLDGQSVGMGGVAGVACEPEDRRNGHIRGLLEAALREMRERGDVLSFLYPMSFDLYRKFGYETCLRLLRVNAPLTPLQRYRGQGRAERFVPGEGGSDPGPIVEVYNDFAEAHNLSVDREGWRWRGLLEQDPVTTRRSVYVWYSEDGTPGAYVIVKVPPEAKPPELQVIEAAWRSPESFHGLLGFLGSFYGSLTRVIWEMPADSTPELIWPDGHDIKSEVVFSGMCRIVHAQKALKLMRKPMGAGRVKIAVNDEALNDNAGTYKIEWEGGEGSARKLKSGGADITCSALALAQLVTGYLPFEALVARRDIEVNGKQRELSELFPGKPVYLADRF